MKKYIFIGIAIVIFGFLIAYGHLMAPSSSPTHTLITTAVYTCDKGKTITAAYYEGTEVPLPKPGEPPVPTGSVEVSLNGAASSTLMQTISADGARYANSDESFVFWSKGNGALILKNNAMDLSYKNCTAQK